MNTSLIKFRKTVMVHMLDLLWRQWTALGIPGSGERETEKIIDPEALLLLTLTVSRFDPRLFDLVLDWLQVNGSYLNIQRLQSLVDKIGFQSGPQLGAIAELLGKKSPASPKWKKLSSKYSAESTSPLFFQKDGTPWPVTPEVDPIFLKHGLQRTPFLARKPGHAFPSEGIPAFLLRFRALLGINIRCEILCLLGSVEEIHPSGIARFLGQSPRAIQKTLADMAKSGLVRTRTKSREKFYSLSSSSLESLLRPQGRTPWENTVPLYRALEILWLGIWDPINVDLDHLTLGSQFVRLAEQMGPLLGDAGFYNTVSDKMPSEGGLFMQGFEKDVEKLFFQLAQKKELSID